MICNRDNDTGVMYSERYAGLLWDLTQLCLPGRWTKVPRKFAAERRAGNRKYVSYITIQLEQLGKAAMKWEKRYETNISN